MTRTCKISVTMAMASLIAYAGTCALAMEPEDNVDNEISDVVDQNLGGTGWESEYKNMFRDLYNYGAAYHKDRMHEYDAAFVKSAGAVAARMGAAARNAKAKGIDLTTERRQEDDKRLVARLKESLTMPLYTKEEIAAQNEYLARYTALVKEHFYARIVGAPKLAFQGFSRDEMDAIAPVSNEQKPVVLGGILAANDAERDAAVKIFNQRRRATLAVSFIFSQVNLFAELYVEEYRTNMNDLFQPRPPLWTDEVLASKVVTAKALIDKQINDSCLIVDKPMTNVLLRLLFSRNLRGAIDPDKEFAIVARQDRIEMANPVYLQSPVVDGSIVPNTSTMPEVERP